MSVTMQRAEFGPDRQFVDVTVELPDQRPGWTVVLQAEGGTSLNTARQPCVADQDATIRFYPFLPPGNYALLARLIPPEADLPAPRRKRVAQQFVELGSASVPPLDAALAAEWLRGDDVDLHQAASRAMMPLCVDPKGVPCFWPLQGASSRRVAVLSIPKAGTYLISKLLENLGIVSCNVHVGRALVGDYRVSKQMPPPVQRHLDVAFSARLVLPGQSMASHMRRDMGTEVSLHDFCKVFAYRELRAALVSAFRAGARRTRKRAPGKEAEATKSPREITDDARGFVEWLERGDIERMRRQYEAVSGWYNHPDVCRVAFEDIMGDAGPERRIGVVTAVAAQCGVTLREDQAQELLAKTVGAETQTFSGARSSLTEYWSPKAEELFRGAGLDTLNRMLGYDAANAAPPEPVALVG